jgi:soluble lytic murein transglycosylase
LGVKRRILLALAVFALLAAAPAARAALLSAEDKLHFRAALDSALDHGAWDRADRFAAETKDPLARKVVRWLALSQGASGASFAEITDFMKANPSWPRQVSLARRAEEALNDGVPTAAILAWFKDRQPHTPMAMVRLAEAQWQTGKKAEAQDTIRRAWVEGNFDAKLERDFLKSYGQFITRADHWARLDRLLWDNKSEQAQRMLPRVDAGHQALAQARIHLHAADKSADYALKRVPDGLLEDPGLLYERARWRRMKNRDEEAMQSFAKPEDEAEHAERWWDERSVLARRRLADGAITDAYRLAKDHGPLDGARLISAEWFAGWVALRYLNEPKTALPHFRKAYEAASTPLSKTRGAYWEGRAYEAAKNPKEAEVWYRRAAAYHYTFYGQLAAVRAHLSQTAPLPPDPQPTAADTKAFDARELVRVARMLGEIGRDDLFKTFTMSIGQNAATPVERTLAGNLALAYGRREVGVQIARDAMRDGVLLTEIAFPTIQMPKGGPEPALLHAVVRQESNFDVGATSLAGARGLMQLIPSTARAISRALNINYQPELLGRDGHYNLKLGQAYLGDMISRYDGSYVLALAAYNAGPSNVSRWIRANGDPRRPEIDVIDWIEQVPYEETRNYIQRVLENLQVYRRRLGLPERPATIEADLARGGSGRG